MHKERDFIERLIQGKKIEKYVTKKLNKKIKNIIIVDDKFNELWKNKLVFKYVSLDKQQRERKYYEELAKYNKKNGDIWIEGTNSTIKIDVKTVKRSGIKDYKGEISESSILGFKGKYFLFATDNENPKM